MERATKLVCPSCGAGLKSERGIRIGKKITCLKCGIAFTVRPEDATRARHAAGLNRARLTLVLVGALLYLMAGGGLAYYCFAHSGAPAEVARDEPEQSSDDVIEAAAPAAPPPVTPPPAPGALSAREQLRTDNAIADGVWFLRDRQAPGGHWPGGPLVGMTALAGLTLLECGVPGSDPAVRKAADYVRGRVTQTAGENNTYPWALAILFLDRLGDKADEELIQYLAIGLLAGQHVPEGAWHYRCPTPDRAAVPQLLKLLADPNRNLADVRKAVGRGGIDGGWDNSNTQFALLGLWAAQRHRVPIGKSVALAEKHFRTTQDKGGTWFYSGRGNVSPWPTMTCAGLLGLAVAHGVADGQASKQNPLDDPDIRRALEALASEIDRPKENRATDLYFLWSLERVGVLYNLSRIGGKDWYGWGRKVLLPAQQKDGSWTLGGYPGANPVVDTCFALLFLRQANLATDLSDKFRLLAAASTTAAPARKD